MPTHWPRLTTDRVVVRTPRDNVLEWLQADRSHSCRRRPSCGGVAVQVSRNVSWTIPQADIAVRIYLPKDNQVLTLVLSGIRAPRTARNASETSEPYGQEASDFATLHYNQRDVEIEVHDTDKSGGFIGALYLNKTENAAITLVKEGLATVHAYSAENLSWAKQLYDAEVRVLLATRAVLACPY